MTEHVNLLEGVDPYEASANVNALLTQIETAYALTARLQKPQPDQLPLTSRRRRPARERTEMYKFYYDEVLDEVPKGRRVSTSARRSSARSSS